MSASINEGLVEDGAIGRFEAAGVASLDGVALEREGERNAVTTAFLAGRSRAALRNLNPHLPDTTTGAIVASLSRPPHPTLIENNRHFHSLLTDGVPVEYKDPRTGERRGGRARAREAEILTGGHP